MAIEEKCGNCRHFRVDGRKIIASERVKYGKCLYPHYVPYHEEHDTCKQEDFLRVYARAFRPTLQARFKDLTDRIRYGVFPRRFEF